MLLAAVSGPWIVSAVAFATSMSATPGPNNAMLASSGSLWGFRRTIPHMLGIAIGFGFMLLAVAAGLGTLLLRHPTAVEIMRWVAAVYLLWLAYRIATATPAPRGPGRRPGGKGATVGLFLQAAAFQWVNPKAWIIVLSGLATLTTASSGTSRAARCGTLGDLRRRHLLQRGALDLPRGDGRAVLADAAGAARVQSADGSAPGRLDRLGPARHSLTAVHYPGAG